MGNSDQEVHLGDIIEKSVKVKLNIEKRKFKGYKGNNILAITNDVPLAHWKMEAGLKFRQALFLNGILYNSEAWHSIEDKDIISLERADEVLKEDCSVLISKLLLKHFTWRQTLFPSDLS